MTSEKQNALNFTVAVIQSNYIPWKGYFDIIHDADLFIFHDDLQFTKNDWRNRNKIKTLNGSRWLTISVGTNEDRLICETPLPHSKWAAEHWNLISHNYKKAPYYSYYRPFFEEIYLGRKWTMLSELNQHIIKRISREILGISTEFVDSRTYNLRKKSNERLIELLRYVGAKIYISGPLAKSYIDTLSFDEAGIKLIWKSYDGYPHYSQFFPPFEHNVSIIDLLFHAGPNSPWYIWGWREETPQAIGLL